MPSGLRNEDKPAMEAARELLEVHSAIFTQNRKASGVFQKGCWCSTKRATPKQCPDLAIYQPPVVPQPPPKAGRCGNCHTVDVEQSDAMSQQGHR